ncbi:MAG: EsaB/YukD family protein, partial [Angustibacter sp.]
MAAVREMCRVTIVTPTRWADVVLPASEPLADLLPALLDHVGEAELVQQQAVLQRLGQAPLNEARSLAANGILDGETLYLTPAVTPLPLLDFDDSIAGLGTGSDELPNRWKPLYTRRMMLALGAGPIALGWVLLVTRQNWPLLNSALAFLVTVLMIVAAGVTSRAWNDKVMAIMLGTGAVVFAGAAGYLTVRTAGEVPLLSLPVGLAVSAAVFSVACIVDRGIGSLVVGFAGVAFAALLAAIAIGAGMIVGWSPKSTAAVMLGI